MRADAGEFARDLRLEVGQLFLGEELGIGIAQRLDHSANGASEHLVFVWRRDVLLDDDLAQASQAVG